MPAITHALADEYPMRSQTARALAEALFCVRTQCFVFAARGAPQLPRAVMAYAASLLNSARLALRSMGGA
jgi:hypothetical protein